MSAAGIDEVVAAARAAAARTEAGRAVVVGIDGRAGAGKTTVAGRVAAALGDCPVVHMDDIYPGWDGLAASIPILVAEILEPIAAGRAARFRRFDWASGGPGAWCEVRPETWLVVEGVGCCTRPAAALIDVPVWMAAPASVRKRRALARDGEIFADNWDRWSAQEQRLFADDPVRERAAVVIEASE